MASCRKTAYHNPFCINVPFTGMAFHKRHGFGQFHKGHGKGFRGNAVVQGKDLASSCQKFHGHRLVFPGGHKAVSASRAQDHSRAEKLRLMGQAVQQISSKVRRLSGCPCMSAFLFRNHNIEMFYIHVLAFPETRGGNVQKSCFQYYYTENSVWVQSFLPPVLCSCFAPLLFAAVLCLCSILLPYDWQRNMVSM